MGKHKKDKKGKKSRKNSSSSDSSSDDELTRLEREKMKLLEEKIKAKKKIKQSETLMEKRARRLQKREQKDRNNN